jgi:hypothetical protein
MESLNSLISSKAGLENSVDKRRQSAAADENDDHAEKQKYNDGGKKPELLACHKKHQEFFKEVHREAP